MYTLAHIDLAFLVKPSNSKLPLLLRQSTTVIFQKSIPLIGFTVKILILLRIKNKKSEFSSPFYWKN